MRRATENAKIRTSCSAVTPDGERFLPGTLTQPEGFSPNAVRDPAPAPNSPETLTKPECFCTPEHAAKIVQVPTLFARAFAHLSTPPKYTRFLLYLYVFFQSETRRRAGPRLTRNPNKTFDARQKTQKSGPRVAQIHQMERDFYQEP